jgi:hypothetical protein
MRDGHWRKTTATGLSLDCLHAMHALGHVERQTVTNAPGVKRFLWRATPSGLTANPKNPTGRTKETEMRFIIAGTFALGAILLSPVAYAQVSCTGCGVDISQGGVIAWPSEANDNYSNPRR